MCWQGDAPVCEVGCAGHPLFFFVIIIRQTTPEYCMYHTSVVMLVTFFFIGFLKSITFFSFLCSSTLMFSCNEIRFW